MKRNDICDPYMLGCSSGSLRCEECIHPRGRSRRPTLASTLHNRHGSARFDAQRNMPARQPLEMPGRYRFHSIRPALWKRVGVASSVDRHSKGGVNLRHTTRRCFSVWLSRSGKAWEDRPGCAIVICVLPRHSTGFGTVAAHYADALFSTVRVAAVRRLARSRASFR
jgi:hypothetical protein